MFVRDAVFEPIETPTAVDEVARRIRQAIVLGVLRDGDRLPAETELAKRIGVGVMTVRAALSELRADGLLETHRGRLGGSFVAASDKAILNWSSFNVGANAQVNFAQPSASSVVLNRVLSTSASEIQGRITANGQVFLVNPGGVLFGRTAQVDVGGLVASTLGITDANFLASRYLFANGGGAGAILNHGALSAAQGGTIALLAPEVRNEGVISARMGTAALAAGDQVTLDWDTDCACGRTSVFVHDSVSRYSEARGGDDKINCVAALDAHAEALDYLTSQ